MNNIILFSIALLFSTSAAAQFTINYGTLKAMPELDKDIVSEVWYTLKKGATAKVMTFKSNPVGIAKAIRKAKEILDKNDLSFEAYTKDESVISSIVKDLDDYENLHLTISIGSSEIERYWTKGEEVLLLKLTEDHYFITVLEMPKK
jgi:hypothetical protein